jgi:sucrose-6-phosphate hydrolase SacC (GH32 family)
MNRTIYRAAVGSLLLAAAAMARAENPPDLLVADFEGDDYGAWKVTGSAFGKGPARGTLPGQQRVTGFRGHGLANSFHGGDDSTGTLTSPTFKIERPYLNFLIGGGNRPGEACINLLVDGKVVRTASGKGESSENAEGLQWATWDVAAFRDQSGQIQIVDEATGSWGHINVDHIVQSATKAAEPTVSPIVRTDVLYDETYRPQFHFTARKNWLNDPNGLVYYQGEYHLFFQHNPRGRQWGNMTWGHAVGPDLVHWEQLPDALEPDALGTMFSGSAVVDRDNTGGFARGSEKTLAALYTAAGKPFTQCLATSTDRGRTWVKYDKNPVVAHIVGENRDPKVIWHAPTARWVMALYKDKNDFCFLTSPDLKTWTHLQDLTVPGCAECPDFFALALDGDPTRVKWVWTAANGHYLVGDFDGKRFTPQGGALPSDRGKNFYAAQTYSDLPERDGRRVQIAWMSGGRYPAMPFNQQMSFPCELKLKTFPEGPRLCRTPVREIDSLHGRAREWSALTLKPGANPLAGLTGELFDIRAEVEPGTAEEFGFKCRGQTVKVSSREKKITCLGASADLVPVDGRVQLQILVDRTSLEVFANDGKVSLTSCCLPRPDDQSLEMFATGGTAKVVSLAVYPLRSAWSKVEGRKPSGP